MNLEDTKSASEIAFSVILISYRHDSFFADALFSVLKQKYVHSKLELIIICKSKEFVECVVEGHALDFDVKIVIENDYRIGPKFMKALELASGDWIAVIDDDDIWRDDKLQQTSNFICNSRNLVYIHNSKQMIDESVCYKDLSQGWEIASKSRPVSNAGKSQVNSFMDCEHNGSCISFRRDLVKGRFEQLYKLEGGLDTFLYLCALESGAEMLCIGDKLTYFRVEVARTEPDFSEAICSDLKRQLRSYEVMKNMHFTNSYVRELVNFRISVNNIKLNLLGHYHNKRSDLFKMLINTLRSESYPRRENFFLSLLASMSLISAKLSNFLYLKFKSWRRNHSNRKLKLGKNWLQ